LKVSRPRTLRDVFPASGRPPRSLPPGPLDRRNIRVRASVPRVARKLAVVGLILLILLLVLPLGLGMAMGVCPDCQAPGPQALSICMALATAITILLSTFAVRIEPRSRSMPLLLILQRLERPPRPA
jgi:hypothetical protein